MCRLNREKIDRVFLWRVAVTQTMIKVGLLGIRPKRGVRSRLEAPCAVWTDDEIVKVWRKVIQKSEKSD